MTIPNHERQAKLSDIQSTLAVGAANEAVALLQTVVQEREDLKAALALAQQERDNARQVMWTCGCGWINGVNLATCAMCTRVPDNLAVSYSADIENLRKSKQAAEQAHAALQLEVAGILQQTGYESLHDLVLFGYEKRGEVLDLANQQTKAARQAHAALVADIENIHRILGDSTRSLNERGADAYVAVRAALTRSKESSNAEAL